MIPGILTSSGNLGGLTPHQVVVTPIAGVALAVGDLVMFDLASSSTYTTASTIDDLDNKKNPFNVVILSTVARGDGGVFGVVLEAAAAGARVKVCIAGVVTAKVVTAASETTAAGTTVLTVGAGALNMAVTTVGCGVGLALAAQAASITAQAKVLFNGYTIGGQAT